MNTETRFTDFPKFLTRKLQDSTSECSTPNSQSCLKSNQAMFPSQLKDHTRKKSTNIELIIITLFKYNIFSKIKIKTTSLLTPITESIALLLSLPWLLYSSPLPSLATRMSLLKSSMMSTSHSSHIHEVFHIDVETTSREAKTTTTWKTKSPSWKSAKSSTLIETLRLRINLSSLIINSSFFIILEQLISIHHLLKFLFCSRIFFIPVWMILP